MVRVAVVVVGQHVRARVGFEDVLVGVDEEAAGAGRRIADAFAGPRVHHLDHHADDVPRRAELAVLAGRVQLAQQVLVQVALHVLILAGNLHVVDGLAGFDEQAGLVDLELGVLHLLGEGAALAAQRLDEGKDLFLDVGQRLRGRKLGPVRPAQVGSGKNGSYFALRRVAVRSVLLAFVKPLEEQEERKLLDGVERIGQPAGPEFVPEGFDLRAEYGVGQHGESEPVRDGRPSASPQRKQGRAACPCLALRTGPT